MMNSGENKPEIVSIWYLSGLDVFRYIPTDVSRNVTYILLMSYSLLGLPSTALDFVEIIILKSSPTLPLIWYAIFENLFFIRFCSFSMFVMR